MQTYRVSATGHSLNYLPEYIGSALGYFADEGILIESTVPSPWDRVLDDLESGTAHAALGGIWVPSMYRGHGRELAPFAQASARAPLALIGREQATDFSWERVAGRHFLAPGGNGASVALYLEMVLEEKGLDRWDIRMTQNLSGSMLIDLFVGGMGDYLIVDELSARHLQATHADLWVVESFGRDGGRIPWSIYYGAESRREELQPLHRAFASGLERSRVWLNQAPIEEIRRIVGLEFAGRDPEILVGLVDDFRQWNMWDSITIDRPGFDRWQAGLVTGGLLPKAVDYGTLVDRSLTEEGAVRP
ncbi:ABC transporter substrate-binding protein [Pseudactinotalea sp. HY158]|uniref:ABC transporter substrate-binding protein n=1 Tax=Pseudactinotalea sp. HY158 TaxID=2654547 RepID=UPI00129C51B2|nr:ABC transporter substrate-binding protein [Pseudactinotalea sp. HY158]QGH68461.1 ABC transporter substrate-binding protein [Pseudactinotalea sp. HY158]